jgi:hydroxymethylpyrimidine pyrophosphatase-like HAD family hydrolase
MKKLTNLVIFDFDNTLMDTPEQKEGMIIYKEKTGQDYPFNGWWSRKESLDMNIFDIQPNPVVLSDYYKHKENGDTICLVTGRMKSLQKYVVEILNKYDLNFNGGIYCRDGGKDTLDFKLNLFKKMIDTDLYKSITIYEDRLEHIKEFQKWISTLDIPNKIIFV